MNWYVCACVRGRNAITKFVCLKNFFLFHFVFSIQEIEPHRSCLSLICFGHFRCVSPEKRFFPSFIFYIILYTFPISVARDAFFFFEERKKKYGKKFHAKIPWEFFSLLLLRFCSVLLSMAQQPTSHTHTYIYHTSMSMHKEITQIMHVNMAKTFIYHASSSHASQKGTHARTSTHVENERKI